MSYARRILPAGLALVALLAAVAPVAGAVPSPTPIPPEAPLQVTVTELLPRAPQLQDAFVVEGLLHNAGTTLITDIRVRLRVGSPVRTRGSLHDADNDRPITESRSATSTAPAAASLASGATTRFRITTTVRALGLSQLGVYPVDIEARGNAGDGIQPLGLVPTWVPFFQGLHVQPTRVAVVWPLVDRPHQAALGAFRDDALATGLSQGGRLGRMLRAGAAAATPACERILSPPVAKAPPAVPPVTPVRRCEPVRVTYAVDPDLLLAAKTMTASYQVLRDGESRSQKPVAAAGAWLGQLAGAAAGGVIALPYGDPDVTAMTRGSAGDPSDTALRDDLSLDAVLGRSSVTETLHVSPLQNVAWPPAGVVTSSAADALSRGGAHALILDPSAYDQPEGDPRRAPSARTPLPSTTGTDLEGLVADPYLSDLVTGELAKDVGSRLAEQRFLAETAIVAAEAPSLSRTLVIAPDRRADANVPAAVGALRDLGRVPWLCPVSLSSVAADQERCAEHPGAATPKPEDRGPLRTSTDDELAPSYLARVALQRVRAVQLADAVLVDRGDPAVTTMRAELRRAVARAESSAWREDPHGANVEVGLLREDLDALVGQVQVTGGHVLLTSNSGDIQVNLQNQLDVPIKVRVRFQSRTLGLITAESPLVDVAGNVAVPVHVHATAQRSGQFFIDAHLVDRNGDDFGAPTVINLRSTRYGRLALALTIGATGVLLIAAAFRLIRRARRVRTANTSP